MPHIRHTTISIFCATNVIMKTFGRLFFLCIYSESENTFLKSFQNVNFNILCSQEKMHRKNILSALLLIVVTGMVWYGIRYGLVWYPVWYGMVSGMVWYGNRYGISLKTETGNYLLAQFFGLSTAQSLHHTSYNNLNIFVYSSYCCHKF